MRSSPPPEGETCVNDVTLRAATEDDAEAIHALVSGHRAEGRLLPRQLDEIRRHAARFVVASPDGVVQACAELAPLSGVVAEIRSLVVAPEFRQAGLAGRLVTRLRERAAATGFQTLTAFTHDARFFVRQDFSIVPRLWVPEKIVTDCHTCPLCLRCEQFAMVLPLTAAGRMGTADVPGRRVAVA
jgi:amino-acid N-acetyltransferase